MRVFPRRPGSDRCYALTMTVGARRWRTCANRPWARFMPVAGSDFPPFTTLPGVIAPRAWPNAPGVIRKP